MNRPQLASALKAESADSNDEASFRGKEPIAEAKGDSTRSTETWSLIVTGCLAAAMIASLSCHLPASRTYSWITILFLSVKLIALTATAGVVGTSIPWFFLRQKPPFRLFFLSKSVAVGWIFFPCITLFYRQQSPNMFLVLPLATIALSLSLGRLFPTIPETDKKDLPGWYTSDLPSLYGLPIADFRPVRALVMAMCFQGALVLAIAEFPFSAGILLSTCLFLLAWRWSVLDSNAKIGFAEERRSILFCASAFFFTVLALIPWVAGKSHSSARNKVHKPPLIAHESNEADVPGSDYAGVILWPPPVKKTEIVPPKPHSASFAIGRTFKPVVIPFDGQYWYFKAPSTRPGPRAHVAHGRATYVNVHSTNLAPLLMEAYQNLGTSIDLECCSEIDVAITNADVRPGSISLAIRLTDSDSNGKPSQNLAERTIVSSKAAQIPLNRPPVEEVLRFPISRPTTIHRFDEITVVFLSVKERARAGAKVSIQSFTLIPK
ncbi:MAG TPA: hypothetical protein VH117_02430 [Edaphobacter sp.]|nr:hypothetical protein [Edaphobacter sp.]